MLKVLHVGKYYPPVSGGMERAVQMLCSVAPDRLDSRVLAFSRGSSTIEEIVDGVPVTRVATLGQAGSVPVAPTFAAHLRRASAEGRFRNDSSGVQRTLPAFHALSSVS